MIANAVRGARARSKEPLEVELTVTFNFGDRPGESVTLLENRTVPLVGSVFENRDRIARGFLRLLLKAGARSPGRLLRRGGRE